MPEMINPFDAAGGYDLTHMTQAVNLIPNQYGRVRQLGLFRDEGITQRSVALDLIEGKITLLPDVPVSAPATPAATERRKTLFFSVPHIPHTDIILPSDIQGVRGNGLSDQPDPLATVMERRLRAMRNKHAITSEFLLIGALKGVVEGATGNTIVDYFAAFSIAPKTVDFVLGTAGTDVGAKCADVLRHIEDNLLGDVMTGVQALVSSEFFDKLIAHATVKEAYKYYAATGAQPLREDVRRRFPFRGIVFEEYRGSAPRPDGSTARFIAAGEGHAFPLGTQDTFQLFYAPANHMQFVNTIGIELYAWQTMRQDGSAIDVKTESNPLPVVRRPGVLVKLVTSN